MASLKRYRSHKVVQAAKIIGAEKIEGGFAVHFEDGGAEILGSNRVPSDKSPVGGYFVQYDDDYVSWSPAEAFEAGYTLVEGE